MTVLTLRRIRQDRFEVTGPDIEPMTFKTRVEARDWCLTHYRGSPIREVGGRKKGTPAAGGYGRTGRDFGAPPRLEGQEH